MMGISKSSYRTLLTAAKTRGEKSRLSEEASKGQLFAPFYHGTVADFCKEKYKPEIESGIIPWNSDNTKESYKGIYEEIELGPYEVESGRPDAVMLADGGPAMRLAIPYIDNTLPHCFTVWAINQGHPSVTENNLQAERPYYL